MTTYISVDVETTGLIPGSDFDLLSVGAVPTHALGNQFHYVIADLDTPNLQWDPSTLEWWLGQTEAAARLKELNDQDKPVWLKYMECAGQFKIWLEQFEKPLMFVAWPASFDYPWIQQLFKENEVDNPFSYRTIDVKSYACGKLGIDFNAGHDDFPEWLNEPPDFPHDALSDAIRQAEVFTRLVDYRAS